MRESEVHMPKELKKKCHKIIHTASIAAGGVGAIPNLPIRGTIPITAAQITMIIGLGKVFDFTLSESTARSIGRSSLTRKVGSRLFANLMKWIPGVGTIVGAVIGATTAATLTETLGWLVADDLYRISIGEEPKNIIATVGDLGKIIEGLRSSKKG